MISLFSTALTKRGYNVGVPLGNAYVDIVKAKVKRSRHRTTTFIGEDTDLLILLLHKTERKQKPSTFTLM
ncbi:hypothetical protein DPMN_139014 [Dreissena polymorpha]|uniref:Uncharacterized protein n=1 Tax=Dreissena polymorpha TaxID=45954 RepID=A0A9D4JG46_DREPO|nr:hypothetical protein DPMN_139014 [Dreissena polymorpha]